MSLIVHFLQFNLDVDMLCRGSASARNCVELIYVVYQQRSDDFRCGQAVMALRQLLEHTLREEDLVASEWLFL
jgi:hypothetical protein